MTKDTLGCDGMFTFIVVIVIRIRYCTDRSTTIAPRLIDGGTKIQVGGQEALSKLGTILRRQCHDVAVLNPVQRLAVGMSGVAQRFATSNKMLHIFANAKRRSFRQGRGDCMTTGRHNSSHGTHRSHCHG
jgi:hypothetical protein